MSTTEILVVAFGLFMGYWLVSKLMAGKPPSSGQAEPARRWPEVLGVAPTASVEEIREAYRNLTSLVQPESKSREISQAYREALQARGVEA